MIYTDGVHLITDQATDDELHVFASIIGFRRGWYQGDHYDITTRRAAERAVQAGAKLIGLKSLARLYALKRRALAGMSRPGDVDARAAWMPDLLNPDTAADRNTALLKLFAPGKRIGRRGTDHLEGNHG